MNYPNFFDKIENIVLKDELSEFLGSFEDGIVEFSYLDIVKSAGHSCPTVAGAYISTWAGLKELYKDEIPKRGEIKVEFKEIENEGVAGVIANVITNITGATAKSGFKGLAGKYSRFGLMFFQREIDCSVKFTRLDTNESVQVYYNPSSIPANPNMGILMQKSMQNIATKEEIKEFGVLWQKRVEAIFDNINSVVLVKKA